MLPTISPSSDNATGNTSDKQCARTLLAQLTHDIMEAQDNLLAAKASQANNVNRSRAPALVLQTGDHIMLATKHRWREYIQKGDKRVTKFMPRYDGPYGIIDAHSETSTYTLDLPNSPNIFPTFHASQLHPYYANDPAREHPCPEPLVTENGQLDNFIEHIIDERKVGRGRQFLVRWVGFGEEDDEWLPRSKLEDCESLDTWEREHSKRV